MSKGTKTLLIVLAVIVILVLMVYGYVSGTYNSLVSGEEGVKASWSQVQNVYQRRADLIPNLVETVKGYAKHERETLQAVVDARSRVGSIKIDQNVINNPQALKQFQSMQGELSGALSRLLVVTENYPQLKANENFLALQSQLEGTENRITVERMRYNEVARQFNTKRRMFPSNILANMFGFQEKAYFEAQQGAENAPKVKFD
jgi:LemA protein